MHISLFRVPPMSPAINYGGVNKLAHFGGIGVQGLIPVQCGEI